MQEYSFECHVPAWTPVDTLNIPGNRIDHAFLEPNISAVSPRNGAVRGGGLLTVYGSYFSVRDSRPVIQIGRTDCATSTWVSDSVVTCVTGHGWDGGHRVVWHSEGSQDAVRSVAPLPFSFDLPAVSGVTPASADQLGGVNVTIFGVNFGLEARHAQFRFLPQVYTMNPQP